MQTVYNIVPNDIKRLERCNNGWVLRYNFETTENEGYSKCVEKLFTQTRRPRMELVQRILEKEGISFVETDYKE